MGKDKRPWRKLVKKLRRKRMRTALAVAREAELKSRYNESLPNQLEALNYTSSDSSDDEVIESKLSEVEWQEREWLAQIEFQNRKDEERRIMEKEEEEKAKLRKEWEEAQTKLIAELEEAKRLAEEKRLKQVFDLLELISGPYEFYTALLLCDFTLQEAEYNQFLEFLCGDIESPPLPFIMPENLDPDGKEVCGSFMRTATCRFGQNCRRSHPSPTLSQIIMIPNFFSHYSLEQALNDEFDADLNLEYNDADLYKSFREFYEDVLPEFQKYGKVIQFKVCCNYEPHLRGNVYLQYENIRQAVEAYRVFNGRYFNGKQISLKFVRVESWRGAICGMFARKRCKMKLSCNFMHVFRNPTKEFVLADNDWKKKMPNISNQGTPRNRPDSGMTLSSIRIPSNKEGSLTPREVIQNSNGVSSANEATQSRRTSTLKSTSGLNERQRQGSDRRDTSLRSPSSTRRSHREDHRRSKSPRHRSRRAERSRSKSPYKRYRRKSRSSSKSSRCKRDDLPSDLRSPLRKKIKKKHKHKEKKKKKKRSS